MKKNKFWENKKLHEMNSSEWEALCDKCGKCCVIKLEDYDTKEIHYTNVSCKLLCEKTALCKDYDNRKAIVPDCKILTPDNLKNLEWMPNTCAYKLLNDGDPLPSWHPLVSGNHHDLFDIEKQLSKIVADIETATISCNGLFLNADAGFDAISLREFFESLFIIANNDINKRNSKNTDYDYLLD